MSVATRTEFTAMSMTCQTDLLVDDVIQTLNSQEEVAKLKQIVQAMQGDLSK